MCFCRGGSGCLGVEGVGVCGAGVGDACASLICASSGAATSSITSTTGAKRRVRDTAVALRLRLFAASTRVEKECQIRGLGSRTKCGVATMPGRSLRERCVS